MASAPIERSGVIQDDATGEMFIPASRRPDGTWRKARRVKEGYIPQDEMPVYENKGVQWLKSKPSLPPGMNPADAAPAKTDSSASDSMSKSAKKNAKRKEKKKQQKESEGPVQHITQSLAQTNLTAHHTNDSQQTVTEPSSSCNSKRSADKQEVLKKVRQLRKKLKQIEELERRIESGDIKEPDKDQREKIAKKQAIVDEMEELQLEMED